MSTKERTSQTSVEPDNSTLNPSSEAQANVAPQEAIARLAYSYWLERQGGDRGSAEEDWLRAERDLRERQASRS